MTVELFSVPDRARMNEALSVRWRVFVNEQRIPAVDEVDEHDRADASARHALVREDRSIAGEDRGVIAAGRYYRKNASTVQIGRMAVLASRRRRGVGRLLLDALLDDARAHGYARAALNAQLPALKFYLEAGFEPHGPTFFECDIVHQAMDRAL